MFIDLFVGQIDLRALRDDQRKLHSPGPGTLAFNEGDAYAQKNELANGSSLRCCLRLKFPIEGDRNVDRRPNGLLFHKIIMLPGHKYGILQNECGDVVGGADSSCRHTIDEASAPQKS